VSEISSEIGRKVLHMLSLVYWVFYRALGYPRAMRWMGLWTFFVVVIETARLFHPGFNAWLMGYFGGIARSEEKSRYTGIFHTTVGVYLVLLAYGERADL